MLNAVKKSNKYLLSVFFIYLIALVFFSLRNEVLYWSDLTPLKFIAKSTNLIPFATVITYIQAFFTQSMNLDIAVRNLVLPIVAFLPCGFLLYALSGAKRKLFHIFLGSAALCLVLEVLQMLLRRGSFDVDDIILSVFGAFLGVLVFHLVSNITSGTLQKPERARS